MLHACSQLSQLIAYVFSIHRTLKFISMALLKKLTSLPLRQVRSLCTHISRVQLRAFQHEKNEVAFNAILNTCKTKYADVFARPDSADDKWDDVRKSLISLGNLTPSITDFNGHRHMPYQRAH